MLGVSLKGSENLFCFIRSESLSQPTLKGKEIKLYLKSIKDFVDVFLKPLTPCLSFFCFPMPCLLILCKPLSSSFLTLLAALLLLC